MRPIVYKISDGNGGVSTASVTVTITPVNDASTTTGLGNLVDNDGSSVNIDVTGAFADLDGDALSYSVSGLPAGLTINTATGVITGTIDPAASTVAGDFSYPITVTASLREQAVITGQRKGPPDGRPLLRGLAAIRRSRCPSTTLRW